MWEKVNSNEKKTNRQRNDNKRKERSRIRKAEKREMSNLQIGKSGDVESTNR